ncbi:type II toxin-antitoxin system VapC family toxin [Rhodopila sp.]|uniref:type II toxin-antitoxin system VapC family toxin n=1 Tax=Rhodopila sp. TaxID=2480087 RepID=UPI003D0B957C
MKLYLDASVLVAMLTTDPLTARAFRHINDTTPNLIISDFASAEVASAIARRVRRGEMTVAAARKSFATLDSLTSRGFERIETSAVDIKGAETFLRRLDLTLRAPDAINMAITQRLGASLMTFDDKMAASARMLAIEVAAA